MRSFLLVVWLSWSSAQIVALAQGNSIPKELIRYVHDAKRLGVTDNQILDGAVRAGWPNTLVSAAIAIVGTGDQAAPSSGKGQKLASSAAAGSPATTSALTIPAKAATSLSDPPALNTSSVEPRSNTVAILRSGVPYDYRIGAGDVLQISVWKEPDASSTGVVVRPDGIITVPLLKEVEVTGLTPTEVEKVIATGLGKVLKEVSEDDVTVIVTGIQSKKIYAVGAVKKEGPIPYTYRMSVMQALSEAGGLTDYAKRKKIYVLRSANGRDVKLPFDYDQVLKGEHMELNIALLPGDTLVVPH